jgi:osmotically-inducible protein OsmY
MRRAWTVIAFVLALTIPYAVAQQSGAQAATQSSVTDATLQTNVQGKLATDAAFKSVVVSVRNGVVDLTGTVPSEPDQKRVKEMASQVPGVKNVTDHLSIGEVGAGAASAGAAVPQTAQSETSKNTAGSIAGNAGAIGTTTGDTTPTNPAVKTQSASGNNAPSGMSVQDSQTQSQQNLANSSNTLGMTPDVDSNTLRSQIDSALKSDPTLSNAQLSVDVNASQITLSGSVPSGKEKQTAVRIAQSYAGNRRVSDKVTLAGKQTPPTTQPNSQNPNAMGTNPK